MVRKRKGEDQSVEVALIDTTVTGSLHAVGLAVPLAQLTVFFGDDIIYYDELYRLYEFHEQKWPTTSWLLPKAWGSMCVLATR